MRQNRPPGVLEALINSDSYKRKTDMATNSLPAGRSSLLSDHLKANLDQDGEERFQYLQARKYPHLQQPEPHLREHVQEASRTVGSHKNRLDPPAIVRDLPSPSAYDRATPPTAILSDIFRDYNSTPNNEILTRSPLINSNSHSSSNASPAVTVASQLTPSRSPIPIGLENSAARQQIQRDGSRKKNTRRSRPYSSPCVIGAVTSDAEGIGKDSMDDMTMANTLKFCKGKISGEACNKGQDDDMPDFSSFHIEDQVADILATFNPTPTSQRSPNVGFMFPDPSRMAYTDPLSNMDVGVSALLMQNPSDPISSSPSLPATIYGLAVSNPSFFLALRKAVPAEYCAISFFKRIEHQIWSIGRRYSEYLYSISMGNGPTAVGYSDHSHNSAADITGGFDMRMGIMMAEDDGLSVPDEKWCERALTRKIENLKRHLIIRRPLGKGAREQAFRALLRALWVVVERAGEEREARLFSIRESLKVRGSLGCCEGKETTQPSVTQRIGLYDRLIGTASVPASASIRYNDMNLPPNIKSTIGVTKTDVAIPFSSTHMSPNSQKVDFFTISAMGELTDVAGPFLRKLEALSERIRSYGARSGYLEEFDQLLAEISRVHSQQGPGGAVKEGVTQASGGKSSLTNRRSSSVESVKRGRSSCTDEKPGKQRRTC